jgi:3',5'-cyclic AMP phosphodiesterase CpdA
MRVLHVSDVHFGRPAVPEQFESIEATIQQDRFDVVAVSGDVSQRARAGEFQRAAVFLRDAGRVSKTIIVPGNHDVMWWRAPLGFGGEAALYESYRAYISPEIEPVLRVPGVTLVGLNTAQGVLPQTLTWNVRDISIIGHLKKSQMERARAEFEKSPETDARVIVMHHNPVKGELSQRHGLKDTRRVLGAFAEMDVDLVLCIEQSNIDAFERAGRRLDDLELGAVERELPSRAPCRRHRTERGDGKAPLLENLEDLGPDRTGRSDNPQMNGSHTGRLPEQGAPFEPIHGCGCLSRKLDSSDKPKRS